MTSALERLAGSGKSLTAEPPDAKEFEGLKRAGLARLRDAGNRTNSPKVGKRVSNVFRSRVLNESYCRAECDPTLILEGLLKKVT